MAPKSSATRRWLSETELDAWRSFLRTHALVTRVLDAELIAEADLPLGMYDVLVNLNAAENKYLRMTDLADRVLLSRSGLTRLVDRMVAEGLVERQQCPTDMRVTYAVLTDAGYQRLKAAAPIHLRGVREHLIDRLTPEEIACLASAFGRVVGED